MAFSRHLTLLLFLLVPHVVWAVSIAETTQSFKQQQKTYETLSVHIETNVKKLASVGEQINALKNSQGLFQTIIGQHRVQKLMAQAQALSTKLENLQSQQSAMRPTLIKDGESLNKQIYAELAKLSEDASTKPSARKNAFKKIQALVATNQKITTFLQSIQANVPTSQKKNPISSAQNKLSRKELIEKYEATLDVKNQIKNDLDTLLRELRQTKQQQFVRAELAHLFDEEAFFSEQNMVRSSASRRENAETEESNAEGSADESIDDSMPSVDDTMETPTDPVEPVDIADDTTIDDAPQDPALEVEPVLEVNPTEATLPRSRVGALLQELNTGLLDPSGKSGQGFPSSQHKIVWLKQRIKQLKSTLSVLDQELSQLKRKASQP